MLRVSRVHGMGVSGSGKTTVANRIAENIGAPHIEMDAINWQPGWLMLPTDELRARIAQVVAGDAWVIDGNYKEVRDLVWGRSQIVVFLDLPLVVTLWRLMQRTIRRAVQREVLWSGNRENLTTAFFSRDSLFLYALRTRKQRRREFEAGRITPAYRHLQFHRLSTQAEVDALLKSLSSWLTNRG